MANIPENLKYTSTHEWVKIDGNIAVVGITDHAQHELSDIVFVELPQVGRKVKAGEACAVVESHKTASDIYSPLSGEIVETNQKVTSDMGLINTAPYGDGWLFKIKISKPDEIQSLLSAVDYSKITG
ncbi:MAG: glycine cleavage system protein GcvH [Verrucomicrobiae bacterium]|nr:glycine cleavage system protein GcvH [Verrucomicrobiae bacterium]